MAEQSGLPSGTVTFLFTDIESSTQTVESMGDEAYADALDTHRQLLREAFKANGGHEVGTEGDAFFVAFARAQDAVAAAVQAQRALDGHALRVRIGLHTGEALVRDKDYVGHDVHKAKRISDAGHGGQILLSQTTADIVRTITETIDLGPHRLKDLGEAQRIFQIGPGEFPRLRSIDSFSTNLPLLRSEFIGREREISTVRELLLTHRLVTLTGIGGCGKTRLAQQVGAESLDDYAEGVFFVELGSLNDPDLIPRALTDALGATGGAIAPLGQAAPTPDSIVASLADRTCLIILDNCEHLLDASAEIVDAIQRRCPNATVLATSREVLGVDGEQAYGVPSLGLPAEDSVDSEAVSLFVSRAQAARPDFVLTPEYGSTIAEICRRLDGIPLALEFAAARVTHLSPTQIAQKLDDRFRLLTGRRRHVQRQQTLQAALDWSYDLLSEDERSVLRRLSVFPADFGLAAAEGVCSDETVDASDVTDLMGSLVAKSLVRAEPGADETRYRLLETVRAYAADRLTAAGESEAFRTRHRDWYVAWIESIPREEMFFSMKSADLLTEEGPNILSALEWSDAQGRPDLIGRIVARARTRRIGTLIIPDHLGWVRRGLEAEARLDPDDRLTIVGLNAVATEAIYESGGVPALPPEIPADVLEAASPGVRSWVLTDSGLFLGLIAAFTRDEETLRRSSDAFEEALDLTRGLGGMWTGYVLVQRGVTEQILGDARASLSSLEEGLSRFAGAELTGFGSTVGFYIAPAAHVLGDHDRAASAWASYMRVVEEAACTSNIDEALPAFGNPIYAAVTGSQRGTADVWPFLAGRRGQAFRAPLRQAVQSLVLACAILRVLEGDHARAARLLSSVRAHTIGAGRPMAAPGDSILYIHYRDLVREALGPDEARRARDEGTKLSTDEALALAFEGKT